MKNVIVITDRKEVQEWSVDDYLTHIQITRSTYSWEWNPEAKPALEKFHQAPIERRSIDGKDYLTAVFPGAADEQEIINLIRANFF